MSLSRDGVVSTVNGSNGRRRLVAVVAVAAGLCLSCTGGSETEGVAEVQAGDGSAAAATTGATSGTSAGGASTAAAPVTAVDPATVATGSEVLEVADTVTLATPTNEMNLQPDDVEWGVLLVDDAYTTSQVDDLAAATGAKLVVVEVQVAAVSPGNLFSGAFRLEADGEWYPTLSRLNLTPRVGSPVNTSLVFEVPAAATALTLEGGLPEELGPGRRARYDIVLAPGAPPTAALPTDTELEATASAITLVSPADEMNLQPDDNEWGVLAVSGARTTVLLGDVVATTTTMLVVVDVEVTVGQAGNLFDNAFRLQADGEWYPALTQLNATPGVGEVANATLVFEVPRTATTFALEGGFPSVLASYPWDFPLRTATYEIVF